MATTKTLNYVSAVLKNRTDIIGAWEAGSAMLPGRPWKGSDDDWNETDDTIQTAGCKVLSVVAELVCDVIPNGLTTDAIHTAIAGKSDAKELIEIVADHLDDQASFESEYIGESIEIEYTLHPIHGVETSLNVYSNAVDTWANLPEGRGQWYPNKTAARDACLIRHRNVIRKVSDVIFLN